jgi:hypothetical protein
MSADTVDINQLVIQWRCRGRDLNTPRSKGLSFSIKHSQMKLQMKREALEKINRQANEMSLNPGTDPGTAMIR